MDPSAIDELSTSKQYEHWRDTCQNKKRKQRRGSDDIVVKPRTMVIKKEATLTAQPTVPHFGRLPVTAATIAPAALRNALWITCIHERRDRIIFEGSVTSSRQLKT